MKLRFVSLLLLSFLIACKSVKLTPEQTYERFGDNPFFLRDGVEMERAEFFKYNPEDIAIIDVLIDDEAVKKYGEKAREGALILETKSFATQKFVRNFSEYSDDYATMIKITDQKDIQYIFNDEVLVKDYEGKLSLIEGKLFKNLIIIDKATLEDKYGVSDKSIGVVIKGKLPKDLYKSDKK